MKTESLPYPLVDVCHGIMVPEFVGGGMGCVCFAPQQVEVFSHPSPVKMGIAYGRKEIFPAGQKLFDDLIISAHNLQHGVMQDNVMLVMPFGITYIQDALFKIYIFPEKQPCFVCADPAAVKEPEKDRNSHFSYKGLLPVVDNRYMVALTEKAAELFQSKSMGNVGPPFFSGNLRRLYRGHAAAIQKTDKTVHHIYP